MEYDPKSEARVATAEVIANLKHHDFEFCNKLCKPTIVLLNVWSSSHQARATEVVSIVVL